ncbi:hypothetical protein [Actinomadura sp. NEAU-AAG7]|nr:hypothetical protein [Actinomadura sp. NEAU-AAG7]
MIVSVQSAEAGEARFWLELLAVHDFEGLFVKRADEPTPLTCAGG